MVTDNAPIYIAVTKAKKRAKNPPATTKEMKRETMMALIVATRRRSTKVRSPVKATRAIVPTCSKLERNHKHSTKRIIYDTPFSWHDDYT